MKLPVSLMNSLADVKDFDREAFERIHASGEQVTSVRINPAKSIVSLVNGQWSMVNRNQAEIGSSFDSRESIHHSPFTIHQKVPWSDYGYYLSQRPSFTFDPLFHAGCYYVQEASSMFLEQVLKQTVDLSRPLKILDLAAAPGGKSTHIQSLISKDSLLVSNEVIRARNHILKENIIKWGCENVIVTSNDPRDFSRLENYFDVLVIDAPCSGSGLFRRDEDAINEWSLNNVQLCSQRQQRIIADAWPCLKKNGILIYATCSYSKEEDENILDWISDHLPVVHCQLPIANWGITEVKTKNGTDGYRFWPYKIKGEGFFIAAFEKTGGVDEQTKKAKPQFENLSKKEQEIIKPWINNTEQRFVKYLDNIHAVSNVMLDEIDQLKKALSISYFGVHIGEIIREKMIPAHAFAMSNLPSAEINRTALNYEQAIQYLKKKDLNFETRSKGWQLVSYEGYSLGWINVLANRINNYYPKELRILKDF